MKLHNRGHITLQAQLKFGTIRSLMDDGLGGRRRLSLEREGFVKSNETLADYILRTTIVGTVDSKFVLIAVYNAYISNVR